MDLFNSLLSPVKLAALQKSSSELLPQLQQAGQFRAIVLESAGNRVILDTAFGQIIGKSPETLNKGDEIFARLTPGNSEPTIKIAQHIPQTLLIKNQALNTLVSKSGQTFLEAKVIQSDAKNTLIQIGKNKYSLPTQKLLVSGDSLLIKAVDTKQVQLNRIQPDSILKNALSALLPRNQPQTEKTGFTALQKIVQSILKIKLENLTANQSSVRNESRNPAVAAQNSTLVLTENKQSQIADPLNKLTHSLNPSNAHKTELASALSTKIDNLPVSQLLNKINSVDDLKNLLLQLTEIRLSAAQTKPESIQKILTLLSLLKPTSSSTSTSETSTVPRQLELLHQSLLKSPEQFSQLIRQLINSQTESKTSASHEKSLLDLSSSFRGELLNQVEQTLNHLLIQKTSVRLQLEQNQPLQFNLNIPLQLSEHKTTMLKLKIRQKSRNAAADEQHWEINLAFEFGLLGLISTHLLLQDKKISAHFWSVNPATKSLIDSHLDDFRQQLVNSGFELGVFDSHQGQPLSANEAQPSFNENLVDINV